MRGKGPAQSTTLTCRRRSGASVLPTCQGGGRGFESRRPLQAKAQVRGAFALLGTASIPRHPVKSRHPTVSDSSWHPAFGWRPQGGRNAGSNPGEQSPESGGATDDENTMKVLPRLARRRIGAEMDADEQTLREAARRLVSESRAAQGLPLKITDPVVIRRVAALLLCPRHSPLGEPKARDQAPDSGLRGRPEEGAGGLEAALGGREPPPQEGRANPHPIPGIGRMFQYMTQVVNIVIDPSTRPPRTPIRSTRVSDRFARTICTAIRTPSPTATTAATDAAMKAMDTPNGVGPPISRVALASESSRISYSAASPITIAARPEKARAPNGSRAGRPRPIRAATIRRPSHGRPIAANRITSTRIVASCGRKLPNHATPLSGLWCQASCDGVASAGT